MRCQDYGVSDDVRHTSGENGTRWNEPQGRDRMFCPQNKPNRLARWSRDRSVIEFSSGLSGIRHHVKHLSVIQPRQIEPCVHVSKLTQE